jgi:AraC family transcriptional regulator of adaptative response/methylated-DNA-[protein]-cysteine methyltransferase
MGDDYARVERAVRYLRHQLLNQPGLDEVAAHVGLSAWHFQRLFRRWVGISPKRYLEFLTVRRAKALLQQSKSVLETAHEVGLTGPSRLHEQFVSIEAATPGEFKRNWRGVGVTYGTAQGPFGEMLIAQTARGVCLLSFVNAGTRQRELTRLRRLYCVADLRSDPLRAGETAEAIFRRPFSGDGKIHLTVRGTNFQVNVWRALLNIPSGTVVSYRQLAVQLGAPRAARAVANAVAANPVNFLIPCHRVLRSDGAVGGYRGGSALKESLLGWELSAYLGDPEADFTVQAD